MRKPIGLGWLAVALAVAGGWPGQASDLTQWRPGVALRLFHARQWEGSFYGETWLNDQGPNPAYLQLAPRLRFHANPYLDLGLGYSFSDTQSTAADGESAWTRQNRLEVEFNPRLQREDGWKFRTRNRMEFRWIEHQPEVNYRSRHLLEVVYPVKLPQPFKDIFSNGEYFYDWSRLRTTEYRLSPLGADLALNKRVGFRVYYTWRQSLSQDQWTTTHVIWTTLQFKLD